MKTAKKSAMKLLFLLNVLFAFNALGQGLTYHSAETGGNMIETRGNKIAMNSDEQIKYANGTPIADIAVAFASARQITMYQIKSVFLVDSVQMGATQNATETVQNPGKNGSGNPITPKDNKYIANIAAGAPCGGADPDSGPCIVKAH